MSEVGTFRGEGRLGGTGGGGVGGPRWPQTTQRRTTGATLDIRRQLQRASTNSKDQSTGDKMQFELHRLSLLRKWGIAVGRGFQLGVKISRWDWQEERFKPRPPSRVWLICRVQHLQGADQNANECFKRCRGNNPLGLMRSWARLSNRGGNLHAAHASCQAIRHGQ